MKYHNLNYFRKRPYNISVDQMTKMFSLLLHFQGVGNASKLEYTELHNILQTNNISVTGLVSKLVPTCAEILERCMWKGTQTRCDTLFQPVNTTEGICCSFNYYGLETNNYQMWVKFSQV